MNLKGDYNKGAAKAVSTVEAGDMAKAVGTFKGPGKSFLYPNLNRLQSLLA